MSGTPRRFDCIILGAGAAGLMCASEATKRGRRVAVLEHNPQPGRKILISGGGRCNFTNLHCAPDRFLSENPHFAKSALALYQPRHFLELVERYRIPWHEKTLGQLFCDHSARAILDMLLAECAQGPGTFELVLNAKAIRIEHDANGFSVDCSQGEFRAGVLVVATGGLSIPKMGATGFAYELARQFGLRVVEPRPALVPLVLSGEESRWTELSGVSSEVMAWAGAAHTRSPRPKLRGPKFREKMLFTHRGLSGPAVLQASSYWRPGEPLIVDLVPSAGAGDRLLAPLLASPARRDETALRQALRAILPLRLAHHLAAVIAPQGWSNAALQAAEQRLHAWEFHPTGTEGFEKAEVTAGGVNTDDLNARTMETRHVPGLFFIGEAVDVTGHLGGFNFQWAWASAVACGRAL
ncbi:NAD(P)/FAD-dependent oxidoreductase [Acidobacteria bacterium AB60]|nr:NAD(P)/FAD-dependent oxidoreductase [Acidobacteria bacterium AB60]